MTDEEAMEALLNSGGYSFPTWTLKLGLPTDEMCLVMSLIASDKAPIPVDVAYYCPHDIAKLLGLYDSDVEDAIAFWSDKGLVDRVCGPLFNKERLNVNLLAWNDLYGALDWGEEWEKFGVC